MRVALIAACRLPGSGRVTSGRGGSACAAGTWLGGPGRLEAPLTGRDAEMRTIRELFHAVAQRRVPRLVLVSGVAGVGKSRLGWEFRKYIDGLAEEVWWHRGRCLSYGQEVAFWALAEMVRQRLGIAEEDPAEAAAAKLADGLERFVPDPGERAYAGARLGRLLGVAVEGDAGAELAREELFAGWRLFFERLAAERPVVLLVEDAQYADSGLVDFLDHLIDWARDLPIFALVFARPELGQARPGFGAGRNRITLALDPLDPASMDALVDALVPGMPAAARSKITSQAQGIPLFAVETVRSLIDRDIVQPVEGVYRLTGDVGELVVPDSLHALLAARLDALTPGVRRLVADAAVLGTTFPAEALTAVSGEDEAAVREALTDLVRREVFSVSADPLSPERGSYQFAQNMLRQVAYETLSRRDRKTRHLAVAAQLRAAFADDGEEVADVIASHLLDALHAIPGDSDADQIRGQAAAALVRSAERAERTGALARAADSYAAAAQLVTQETEDGQPAAGALWERAARAANTNSSWATAIEHAGRARDYYQERGQARAAARAQAIAGKALRGWGRHAEAHDQLTAAVEVLRADPDTDTVKAVHQLAWLATAAESPDADRLTIEALTLGQALDVGDDLLSWLLEGRGIYLGTADRRAEAAVYLRESARLATQASDNIMAGSALGNLAWVLSFTNPAAAAEAARSATGHLRRAGARGSLAWAIGNLVEALLELGDWDAADDELTQAVDSAGLADRETLTFERGWLAALHGDADTAEAMLATLTDLRASEDPQDKRMVAVTEAFTAAARRQPGVALRHARAVLAYTDAAGMSDQHPRWAWSLAARAAGELRDTGDISDLLGLLDALQPGHLVPMLRAERDLARVRLAALRGDTAAAASFVSAVSALREHSTPYHLAHGLLDHAEHLAHLGDADAAAGAIGEALDIGRRLRCQPLLNRAGAMTRARDRIQI
jgi:predicted ATPase